MRFGTTLLYDMLQGSKVFVFHGGHEFVFKNLLRILFPGHLGSERPLEEEMNAKSVLSKVRKSTL